MTTITEGTHYSRIVIEERKFAYDRGELLGYCAYNRDGKAVLLRRTHPDICDDDLLAEGERQRAVAIAESHRQARRRRHN